MVVAATETALDWYLRSERQRAAAQIPTDPSSAAAAFVRGKSDFAPLDAAWRTPSSSFLPANNSKSYATNHPVVILEGSIGKTWTLLSLAARFVVFTRASRFSDHEVMEETESPSTRPPHNQTTSTTNFQPPQVVLLDSNWDMTMPKLAYMVRSTLLREPSSSSSSSDTFRVTEETLESEVEDCLRRIHLATVDEVQDAWVPILECLRCKLKETNTKHPTLLLWDGFDTDSQQPEVRRQILRLLHDCSVAMVATSRNGLHMDWLRDNDKRDLHRIQLEHKLGKDCYAVVNGSKLPFSISLGGVLS